MSTTKTYLVWSPDFQTREDAGEYDAATPEFAGEYYMEDNFDGAKEYYLIAEDPDGNQFEVDVDVEYVPSYFAVARKIK